MSSGLSARVLKVMSVFGGVQALGVLCSIVRIKFVALWLGPAGIGLFGIFNGAADMLKTLTQLGFRDSSVRDVVAHRTSPSLGTIVTVIRRWGFILGILGAVVMAGAAPLLSLKTFGNYDQTLSFVTLGLALFLMSLSSAEQALMQGMERLRGLAKASVFGMVAGLAVSLPMYRFWGLSSVVPSIIAYTAATCAALIWYRVRGIKAPAPVTLADTLSTGRRFIVLGVYMTSADFIAQLVSYIFLSWLNMGAGGSEVGYYQAGFTIINRYIGMVLTAMVVEYYPRLSSALPYPRRIPVFVAHEMSLLLLVIVPAVLLLISLAPWVVSLLYTADFAVTVPFVTLAMTGVLFRAMSCALAYVILAKGDGITYLVTESLSAATALVLNIGAYRLWGLGGLGVSYTLWYFAYFVIVSAVYTRRYSMRLPRRTMLFATASVLAVCVCSVVAVCFNPLIILPAAVIAAIVCLRALYRLIARRRGSR